MKTYIDTKRPAKTKEKGGNPAYFKPTHNIVTKCSNKSGRKLSNERKNKTWLYSHIFHGAVFKTLDEKVFEGLVVVEKHRDSGEVRYLAQETIKEFNSDQGCYEEVRIGKKYEVLKITNNCWKEVEPAIEVYTSLADGIDGISESVDVDEVFFK